MFIQKVPNFPSRKLVPVKPSKVAGQPLDSVIQDVGVGKATGHGKARWPSAKEAVEVKSGREFP